MADVDQSCSPGITQLLDQWRAGDAGALERLVPRVYAELRALASRSMRRERGPHTLQPTALIHEAYLRLVGQEMPAFRNRAHFLGVAANLMRQILVDSARARQSAKRGGGQTKIPLSQAAEGAWEQTADILALHEALGRLEQMDARKSRIVELHYFGGLTVDEVAEATELSPRSVARELRLAKAWLSVEMGSQT
ncbi:MAG: sigma-70 family RNA polymerase sigma factor [Bryobacteraceae bacterium]